MSKMFLHPILDELVEAGIPITFIGDGYEVPGFYFNKPLKLTMQEGDRSYDAGALQATSGQGFKKQVRDLVDLTLFNFDLLGIARRHSDDDSMTHPHPLWIPLLVQHGLIEQPPTSNMGSDTPPSVMVRYGGESD